MQRKRKPRRDSEKCSIVNRTVSFNIEDPFQLYLLEAVDSWTNFSGSVKRLISAALSSSSRAETQTLVLDAESSHTSISNGSMSDSSVDAEPWDPSDLF